PRSFLFATSKYRGRLCPFNSRVHFVTGASSARRHPLRIHVRMGSPPSRLAQQLSLLAPQSLRPGPVDAQLGGAVQPLCAHEGAGSDKQNAPASGADT
ncbi:MAG TPA: hypothetical protein VFG23_05395, partial [Polyangia bacterium]|nr:hypothetical protein [Polyangia bacterium]